MIWTIIAAKHGFNYMSRRLIKRNTCHLLIRSVVAGIWTFGCRTSWSLVYVRLKIMHGIEKIMAPSTHVCSLPDFYLGMDLHGKCAESCVDWKGWLKVLEAYTHHRAANQLQKPVLRQIVDRAPFWTRSAQRLAWVADPSSYMEGHRRHVLRHGAKRNICLWCHLIRSMLLPPLKPPQSSRSSAWLCSHLFLTTHATSIRIKARRNVNK